MPESVLIVERAARQASRQQKNGSGKAGHNMGTEKNKAIQGLHHYSDPMVGTGFSQNGSHPVLFRIPPEYFPLRQGRESRRIIAFHQPFQSKAADFPVSRVDPLTIGVFFTREGEISSVSQNDMIFCPRSVMREIHPEGRNHLFRYDRTAEIKLAPGGFPYTDSPAPERPFSVIIVQPNAIDDIPGT